ncbi:glycosyltransferase [Aequorivita sp. H23M31]|uniref:Glycosyltransferase n=1 Tax=Aequorivita ciconiae TaxID=2494375 RepID=A0A410G5W6_9FLAO|nr:glycosyltransferase [Aequorivita sp. H23M31]QAA82621.1 glycosyltransferase [Aequorivita sp. H23M31]
MIIFLLIIYGLYFICMMALIIGFRRIPLFNMKKDSPLTHFSIVIPFRNESENLPSLLKSISNLNYPSNQFEVLLVNDDSVDGYEEIIKSAIEKSTVSIHLLQNRRLSNSPKKDAITEAIKHSKFDWIITTDADCELPQYWLQTFDSFIQKKNQETNEPIMICGPVIYKSNYSFIQNFQQMDGLSLQAVTLGSFGLKNPILCNGANLAYRKDAFKTVNGFAGNDHIASGDDIFLMEKFKKIFPTKVKYLKSRDAIVSTKPQASWAKLINQRVRWASKTGKQKSHLSIFLGLLVLMVNILFLLLPFAVILDIRNAFFYVGLILFKMFLDLLVIKQTAKLFRRKISFINFPKLAFTYATVVIAVSFKSLNGKYSWKGRNFKNQK